MKEKRKKKCKKERKKESDKKIKRKKAKVRKLKKKENPLQKATLIYQCIVSIFYRVLYTYCSCLGFNALFASPR